MASCSPPDLLYDVVRDQVTYMGQPLPSTLRSRIEGLYRMGATERGIVREIERYFQAEAKLGLSKNAAMQNAAPLYITREHAEVLGIQTFKATPTPPVSQPHRKELLCLL